MTRTILTVAAGAAIVLLADLPAGANPLPSNVLAATAVQSITLAAPSQAVDAAGRFRDRRAEALWRRNLVLTHQKALRAERRAKRMPVVAQQ